METEKRYTLFISYRHSDNASGFVSNLVEKLRTRFGADSVFFDEDDLESEKSFPAV